MLGLLFYGLGQAVYLGQVLIDHNPSPAPSDLLFLSIIPAFAVGIVFTLRSLVSLSRAERTALITDALCVFIAVITFVLALYLPRIDAMPVIDVIVMTAYPAGFFSFLGVGIILCLAAGTDFGRRSPRLLLLGMLISGLCWVQYNELAFGDQDLHHPLIATGFSVGALCLALGIRDWHLQPSQHVQWRRGAFLTLRLVPLALVAGAAVAIALHPVEGSPLVNALINICALLVIVLAVLRQGFLLWDRDRLLSAETELADALRERESMAHRLREAERLEAIGRLAGGVAHDFNNLLAAVLGHCELARRKVDHNHPLVPHLQAIHKAGNRGSDLVRQLLGFARRQFAEPKPIDCNSLLREADQLLRRTLGEHIDLAIYPSSQTLVAEVDPGQMVQVILNLAANARDAMPEGGTLTIEVGSVELDKEYCNSRHDVTPGPYCLLAITDTGSGISADDLPRVFEPFFTTKGDRSGTGLGLASCHGIIKQHRGHIAVYSEPEQGTTIKVYLPRVQQEPQSSTTDRFLRQGNSGPHPEKYRILVCEDDPTIRDLIAGILQAEGYHLLLAENGAQALRLIEDNPQRIDLLLTDVVMPQMSGAQLAQQLIARHPNVRVLYISGYTENVIVRQGILKPGVNLLQKPFTLNDLLMRVQEELAAGSPSKD